MTTKLSAYREAANKFGSDTDKLYEYLRANRLSEPSLTLGYYLLWADRNLNLNQAEVAEKSGVSRGFISALLSGQTNAVPSTYTRIARAVGANPIEFFLAEGWMDPGDLLAWATPGGQQWMPIAGKLAELSEDDRVKAIAVVNSVLDVVLWEGDKKKRK